MRFRLLSVGRPKDELAATYVARYARRIVQLGVPCEVDHAPECRVDGRYSEAHVREREARGLLERLPPRTRTIALHPLGESWTSEELAARLERWATGETAFVVGGPLGLGDLLLDRAEARWSLSAATFPHELVLVLVAEQVYRALTLLRRVPYHK